jgi:hypothetical protein
MQEGSRVFVCKDRMPRRRVNVRQGGRVHVADSMEEVRGHVRHARKHLITAKLIEEGWVYDTPERRGLIEVMLEDKEMMMQVLHESMM